MNNGIKVICTIGPGSLNLGVLEQFEVANVDLVRINLSHVETEEIEDYVLTLRKFKIPIAIDTEGSQIRTGNIKDGTVNFKLGDVVNIHRSIIECDSNNIYLMPLEAIGVMKPGDEVAVGFDSSVLRVEDVSGLESKSYIKTRVIIPGAVHSNKGVHCINLHYLLPPFSSKDIEAVKLAKKYDIRNFTLSFMSDVEQVEYFRSIYPEATMYAKIETGKGVQNASSILKHTDGILIDRSDLSREVPVQEIQSTQRALISLANSVNKEVFIASHILETMTEKIEPALAESDAIVNAIADGVSGFVLSKETAIGKYPVETVKMMNMLIDNTKAGAYEKRR